MNQSFRMTRAEVLATDENSLRAAILAATGSESGTASIIRSLERMGTDESIEFFEMTEVVGARRAGGAAPAGWRVRADRGRSEEEALAAAARPTYPPRRYGSST